MVFLALGCEMNVKIAAGFTTLLATLDRTALADQMAGRRLVMRDFVTETTTGGFSLGELVAVRIIRRDDTVIVSNDDGWPGDTVQHRRQLNASLATTAGDSHSQSSWARAGVNPWG